MPPAVTVGAPAPDFTVTDVHGTELRLRDLRGQRVMLTFFRTAGCPVCNFHYLQLVAARERLEGLTFLAVYQSAPANLKKYADSIDGPPFARFVADPGRELYSLYGVERSLPKMLSGVLFHGGFAKFTAGKSAFRTTVADDGSLTGIGADFLIDEDGVVRTANRGAFSGDHLAIEDIEAFVKQRRPIRAVAGAR
jgi:peroxiredoxin